MNYPAPNSEIYQKFAIFIGSKMAKMFNSLTFPKLIKFFLVDCMSPIQQKNLEQVTRDETHIMLQSCFIV